jgi:hypothetical protein
VRIRTKRLIQAIQRPTCSERWVFSLTAGSATALTATELLRDARPEVGRAAPKTCCLLRRACILPWIKPVLQLKHRKWRPSASLLQHLIAVTLMAGCCGRFLQGWACFPCSCSHRVGWPLLVVQVVSVVAGMQTVKAD